MEKIEKVKQGRSNRAKGGAFERRVRLNLEKHGFIVSKWSNTVEFTEDAHIPELNEGKLIPAKRKYNPFNKALSIGTGWPDFIAYKDTTCTLCDLRYPGSGGVHQQVIGVEAKSNGYLDKKEKAMATWLLENNIFSKIYIGKRGKKRGVIEYKSFEIK